MKKRGFVLGIISMTLVMGFLLGGCASVETVYQDPSLSWQEQALILPSGNPKGSARINGLDGNIIGPSTIGTNVVGVIPSGSHTIHVHVSTTSYGRSYETRNPIPITYEFQPGGRYVLYGTIETSLFGIGDGGTAVRIMTVDEYRAEYAKLFNKNTDEEIDSGYKSWVLDRFEKAEAELSK